MDGGRTLFLQLPREKAIDIEFEDVAFSVSEGRKGKDGAGVLIVWEKNT
jgi:DNA-binding cell septation regulator SpoVG